MSVLTKKEIANMRNNSEKLADVKGIVKVRAVHIETAEEVDQETGEITTVKVGYIMSEEGKCFCTISPTAIRSIKDIEDILTDGDTVSFTVNTRKSAKGRDFITLNLS